MRSSRDGLPRVLSKFVMKTPHGIGLGMPETMEMALRECGVLRILWASFCGMVGKILGEERMVLRGGRI